MDEKQIVQQIVELVERNRKCEELTALSNVITSIIKKSFHDLKWEGKLRVSETNEICEEIVQSVEGGIQKAKDIINNK